METNEEKYLIIPRVTIGMGAPAKLKVGYFNFSTGQTLKEIISVSLLGQNQGFVLYGGIGTVRPRCFSSTGINPSAVIKNPITPPHKGGCTACFANKWGQDYLKDILNESRGFQANGDKPLCDRTLDLLLASADGVPFVLRTKSHNVPIVKEFFCHMQDALAAKQLPVYSMSFDLRLTPMDEMQRRYKLAFGGIRRIESAERLRENCKLYKIFGGHTREMVSLSVAEKPAPEKRKDFKYSSAKEFREFGF